MARVAHAMAKESSRVIADVVEIQEFPGLAQAYMVRGVPKTVINDSLEFVGAVPEQAFISHVLRAAGLDDLADGEETQSSGEATSIG